jgi:hypothetical protein
MEFSRSESGNRSSDSDFRSSDLAAATAAAATTTAPGGIVNINP